LGPAVFASFGGDKIIRIFQSIVLKTLVELFKGLKSDELKLILYFPKINIQQHFL
jgi:hypothetical protein